MTDRTTDRTTEPDAVTEPLDLGLLADLPQMSDPALRRPPPGGARRLWQTARVVGARQETPHARTLRLALPVWHPHTPGQHYVVRLTAPDGYRAERSYSVASPPEDAGHVELTVERLADGEVSPHLHDAVEVGDELEVRGPFGGWFVWNGSTPAVLVGGGSGVVPLMAMVRHHRALGLDVPLRMLVSARSPEELFYADELGPETTVVYTRVVPAGWPRLPARLSRADVEAVLVPGATVYVCGSAGFAAAAERLLLEAGVPSRSIRVERFGPL